MAGDDPSAFAPPLPRTPQELVAPVVACALFQTFSQAILFVQLFTYVFSSRVSRPTSRNRESRYKVAYVLLVSSLSAAQTARYIYLLQRTAVEGVDLLAIRSRWMEPLLNAAISCLVRLFFVYRTYRMLPKWHLAALLLATQALIFGCQMWLVAQIFIHCDKPYIFAGNIPFDLSTAGALFLDILLATILCICILRSRTGIDYLDRFLNRVVVFLWSCSIPPALLMIPAVVIYHLVGDRLGSIWCGVCLAMSAKLYCHSLMRSLNSRDRLKGRLQQERENFNSSEARKEGEGDPPEGSNYSRESVTGSANHASNSLEDGAPSRFSSQTTFFTHPISPSRSRFPPWKSLAQINEPEQELANMTGYYASHHHPSEVSAVEGELELVVTRPEEP